MNNVNILISVLYLKEASDLIKNDIPELSFNLLNLSKTLLDSIKNSDLQLDNVNNDINLLLDDGK